MIDISYRNYFSSADQTRRRAAGGSRKSGSNDRFKIKAAGNAIYIEQTSVQKGMSWEDIRKIPGKYALKDGVSITVYHSTENGGYKFFHAAESTDEYPVLVAKGVDEHGIYFEEKINVRQINPYNTSALELQALAHFKPGEFKTVSNPYDCMQGQEKGLRERFDFVAGAKTLIAAWKRIGQAGQAKQWNEELDFLLGYTENTAGAGDVGHRYKVDMSLFEGMSRENKRNLELYCNAAMERLVAGMAKSCSDELLKLL